MITEDDIEIAEIPLGLGNVRLKARLVIHAEAEMSVGVDDRYPGAKKSAIAQLKKLIINKLYGDALVIETKLNIPTRVS